MRQKLDANIVAHGDNIGVAKKYAEEAAPFSEMTYVNGYDDPEIIAGASEWAWNSWIRLPTRTRTTTSWCRAAALVY